MDREKEFARILSDLLFTARMQGNAVTKEQIAEAFSPLSFSGAQLEEIGRYFRERKVSVVRTLPEQTAAPGMSLSVGERAGGKRAASLTAYLAAVKKKRRLKEAEIRLCFEAARAGDADGRMRLIEHYLVLVTDIARLYEGQGVLSEDLVGEGNVALVSGVDAIGGTDTPEEAEQMLSGQIMNAMEDLIRQTVQTKADEQKTLNRVQEVADKARELADEYRRDLTLDELLEETGWDRAAIEEVLHLTGGGLDGLSPDGDGKQGDTV